MNFTGVLSSSILKLRKINCYMLQPATRRFEIAWTAIAAATKFITMWKIKMYFYCMFFVKLWKKNDLSTCKFYYFKIDGIYIYIFFISKFKLHILYASKHFQCYIPLVHFSESSVFATNCDKLHSFLVDYCIWFQTLVKPRN